MKYKLSCLGSELVFPSSFPTAVIINPQIILYICVCVCVCVYIYIYIYIYIYTHVYIFMYICLYIYVCVCVCMCVYIYIYIHTHTHRHTLIYLCIYVYIYVCVCVCVCVCIYSSLGIAFIFMLLSNKWNNYYVSNFDVWIACGDILLLKCKSSNKYNQINKITPEFEESNFPSFHLPFLFLYLMPFCLSCDTLFSYMKNFIKSTFLFICTDTLFCCKLFFLALWKKF